WTPCGRCSAFLLCLFLGLQLLFFFLVLGQEVFDRRSAQIREIHMPPVGSCDDAAWRRQRPSASSRCIRTDGSTAIVKVKSPDAILLIDDALGHSLATSANDGRASTRVTLK